MRTLPLFDLAMHEVSDITIDRHFPQYGNVVALQITTRRGVAVVALYDLPDHLVSKLTTAFGEPRRVSLDGPVPHQIAAE